MSNLQPIELIASRILSIRGQKVMIDTDLAELYGVPTKRLNEQVKRNPRRFPDDFMFQLTEAEKQEVVANCDHLSKLKFSSALPFAFTEHGAIQAANVLNSPRAAEVGVYREACDSRNLFLIPIHKTGFSPRGYLRFCVQHKLQCIGCIEDVYAAPGMQRQEVAVAGDDGVGLGG